MLRHRWSKQTATQVKVFAQVLINRDFALVDLDDNDDDDDVGDDGDDYPDNDNHGDVLISKFDTLRSSINGEHLIKFLISSLQRLTLASTTAAMACKLNRCISQILSCVFL